MSSNFFEEQNATTCPDYPVLEFTLVLEDSRNNNMTVHSPEMSRDVDFISIVVENLRRDTIYYFYVHAVNSLDASSELSPMTISKFRAIRWEICTVMVVCMFSDHRCSGS